MSDPVLAAWRDASMLNSPGVATKYHVVVDDNAACSQPETWSNRSLPLDLDHARLASEVEPHRRCRRPGCARRWPDPLA